MRAETREHLFDVAVIGAGVVGCAVARDIGRRGMSCVLVDRADDVGDATSKANTAILHTGFDAEPGTLESRLVARGHQLLSDYAGEAGVALERIGALVLAWDDDQRAALPGLREKALSNGYGAVAVLDAHEAYRREPFLGPGCLGALAIPDESIIDPWSTTIALATDAVRSGVDLRLETEVVGVTTVAGVHRLETTTGSLAARWVCNVAGLGADRLDNIFGHAEFHVTARRGQLVVFDKMARQLVSSILLPVPTQRSKGVLVAPTVYGNVLLGPTAEDLDDRTDTASTADGVEQLRAAGSRVLPRLLDEEVTSVFAGLRAATEHRDFQIRAYPEERYLCVGGIRSTGLTASMAIAEHVVELLGSAGEDVVRLDDASGATRFPPLGECQVRPYRDAALIATDPEYGRIVCHCELVSAGELRDAFESPVPPRSTGGIRRRTRAMNGRCQGFYCAATVVSALAAARGIDPRHLLGLDGGQS